MRKQRCGVSFIANPPSRQETCRFCNEAVATLRANCRVNSEASVACCEKEECQDKAATDAIEIANSILVV